MKPLTIVGAILLALGAAGLIWGGVEYFDNRHDLQIGDVNVIIEDDIPPMAIGGAIAAGVGVVALVAGALGRGRSN
jgi:hypothetical protein